MRSRPGTIAPWLRVSPHLVVTLLLVVALLGSYPVAAQMRPTSQPMPSVTPPVEPQGDYRVYLPLLAQWGQLGQAATLMRADGAQNSIAQAAALNGLVRRAQAQGRVRVIVGLAGRFQAEGRLAGSWAVRQQRQTIRQQQQALVAGLRGVQVGAVLPFATIPYLALTVDASALRQLAAHPEVISIVEDGENMPFLEESVPLMGGQPPGPLGIPGRAGRWRCWIMGLRWIIPSWQGRWCPKPAITRTSHVPMARQQ